MNNQDAGLPSEGARLRKLTIVPVSREAIDARKVEFHRRSARALIVCYAGAVTIVVSLIVGLWLLFAGASMVASVLLGCAGVLCLFFAIIVLDPGSSPFADSDSLVEFSRELERISPETDYIRDAMYRLQQDQGGDILWDQLSQAEEEYRRVEVSQLFLSLPKNAGSQAG